MPGRSIERIKIDHYGQLSDIDLDLKKGLNAFYGPNESGKTLIVEAVTKMLLDKVSFTPERISQDPHGVLEIGGEDASQLDLEEVIGGIDPSDVRNAFIIRDYDLRLPERDNSFGNGDYFKDVTDRILGSKTQKIKAIRKNIEDINHLTRSDTDAKLENVKGDKLRNKKESANNLREEIKNFQSKMEEKDIIQKFSEVKELEKEIKIKEEKKEKLENAKKASKYKDGQSLLKDIREAETGLKEIESEERELEDLNKLKKEAMKFEPVNETGKIYQYGAGGSLVISSLAIIAAISNPLPHLIGISVFFFLSFLFFAYKYREVSRKVKGAKNKRKEILNKAEAKDTHAENIEEVKTKIEGREDELDQEETKLKEKKTRALTKLEEKFDQNYESVEKWETELQEFEKKFEETDIDYDEGDIEDSKDRKSELEEKEEEVRGEISSFRDELSELDKKLGKTIDSKFVEDEKVEIETLEDLQEASNQLKEFTTNLDEMVDNSIKTLEILEEMEEEEGDEFNEILEDGCYAVEMFNEATGGNYIDIDYDKDSQEIKVERKDGEILRPEKLSQGTYDLLYMSIRLALAREILEEPGFLILDNAFLHSDINRIEKEIKFLETLEDEGWQIIYFTFREDVKKALDGKIMEELESVIT